MTFIAASAKACRSGRGIAATRRDTSRIAHPAAAATATATIGIAVGEPSSHRASKIVAASKKVTTAAAPDGLVAIETAAKGVAVIERPPTETEGVMT